MTHHIVAPKDIVGWTKIVVALLSISVVTSCVFVDGSFHRRGLKTVIMATDDNPGLRLTRQAVVDHKTGTVTLEVPTYFSSATAVVQITIDGIAFRFNGQATGPKVAVNLTQSSNISVEGLDGDWTEYRLLALSVPASSAKDLVSLAIASVSTPVPSYDQFTYGWYKTAHWNHANGTWMKGPNDTTIAWKPFGYLGVKSSWQLYPNLRAVKLLVESTGIACDIDGIPILQDAQVSDLSVERILTVWAEDGTKAVYRLQVAYDLYISGSIGNSAFSASPLQWNPGPSLALNNGDLVVDDRFCPYPVTTSDGITLVFNKHYTLDIKKPLTLTVANPYGESLSYQVIQP